MLTFWESLRTEYPALAWTALVNLLLVPPSLAGLLLDPREVAGISPWIKPLKFETSIVLYVLTVGWMLLQLQGPAWPKRVVAFGAAFTMLVEISAILLQAARGVGSHFNNSTPFNGMVFATMGVMIAMNTAFAALLLFLFLFTPSPLPPAMLWGVRLGLVLFLIASAEGALIVRNMAHTVGTADGGPGLPFLNWSTRFGDLRVAHFAGMHGIQILPALGWLLSRQQRTAGVPLVGAAFLAMAAVFVFALRQALAARPLWRG
ncbi:MAG: hypothetical protein JNK87_13115 [Bryobacterales bacterium]|nr:hypothetical protein [Bryobacterales bacterium]